jgi:hypothetical protein
MTIWNKCKFIFIKKILIFFLICNLCFYSSESIDLIKSKLKSLKYEFGKLFNNMLSNSYVSPIMESIDSSNQKIQSCVDNFVRICHDLLEYPKFLCYYEEKFHLNDQVDLIYQINKM